MYFCTAFRWNARVKGIFCRGTFSKSYITYYMSTDKQELALQADVQPARKRVRISKSSKEDHVYQANTDGQGERFDSDEQKAAARKASPAIFAVDPAGLVPPRKNRGRPSKAYLEALAEYERKVKLLAELKSQAAEVGASEPEDEYGENTVIESSDTDTAKETPEAVLADDVRDAETSVEKGGIVVSDTFIVLRDVPPAPVRTPVEEVVFDAKTAAPDAVKLTPKILADKAAPTSSAWVKKKVAGDAASAVAGGLLATRQELMTTSITGVLELEKDNSGYLRSSDYNYLPSPDDVLVNSQLVRQYGLRTGDVVECDARLPRSGERAFVAVNIRLVNALEACKVRDRVPFEDLIPLFPDEKFKLCSGEKDSMSCRIVDLFSPIGKGQRALIVAQPKTGKTLLMKDVANAIARNHPDTHLIMLLIDERPEEVTDMARTVNAEVIASTFDEPASQHVRIANIVLEKAKRMVECGHDVVIFLDSITRLARAYNTVAPTSGKMLSGGVEATALQKPKRFFGAARNIEGGGSLTIIATALIETGSKMDEVIFEEFKGTGNMELQLERILANKRIFPAVNLIASSTRRDELLLDEMTRSRMWGLRNYLSDMNPIEAMKFLRQRLDNTRDNQEFIVSINS